MFTRALVILFCFIATGISNNIPAPEVTISNGALLGENRNNYFAFEGIPYAEPPIGDLRFEPPVPFSGKFDSPRDATKPGPSCMQWDHFKFDEDDKLRGSEDCLYLNVYTPSLEEVKLPVVVNIHGGGLQWGNGDAYGPEVLMTRKFVYVTFNYRLGPLGFLTTECPLVPGNMGMKDQVMALRFVKENIGRFGGDPDNITITGWSAGGASVHFHYLSPMSNGLFHRGVSFSGCALNPWPMMENGLGKTKQVASLTGCERETHADMIKCLKEKPAEEIVRTVKTFQNFLYNPFSPFGVVVEISESRDQHHHHHEHEHDHHHHKRHHHQQEGGVFLTDTPVNLIKSHNIQHLPWIAAGTFAEGLYPAAEFLRRDEYLPMLNDHWKEYAPSVFDFNYTVEAERRDEVSEQIRKHYLGDDPISKESFPKLLKAMSDSLFLYGLGESVRLHGPMQPVYFYYYGFKKAYSIGELMSGKDELPGLVSHGDDMTLLLPPKYFPKTESIPVGEQKMTENLLTMLETFASGKVPKFGDMEMVKSTSSDEITYLEITGPDNIETKSSSDFGGYEFWKSLNFHESCH